MTTGQTIALTRRTFVSNEECGSTLKSSPNFSEFSLLLFVCDAQNILHLFLCSLLTRMFLSLLCLVPFLLNFYCISSIFFLMRDPSVLPMGSLHLTVIERGQNTIIPFQLPLPTSHECPRYLGSPVCRFSQCLSLFSSTSVLHRHE